MSTKDEVLNFLRDFKVKLRIWGVVYRDERNKNAQALLALDITPARRTEILNGLEAEDYSSGPIEERLYGGAAMWVFGKHINRQEVYIKITMGMAGRQVICISFHLAERPMTYPLNSVL